MHAGLCYDVCSPGFSDHSTPTCTRDCPSGYTDTGLTCHYNGQGSYSPVHWDGCKSRAPKWLGGGCIGGLTEDSCRAGYNKVLSMCYINVPPGFSGSGLDPMKTGTYSRTGRLPECTSDKENSAGLCYPKPRDGYQCSLTACQKQCAAGTSACGVAACAVDTKSCAMGIVDMVMAPLDIIMNIATAGAAGKAVKGATDAGKIAANAKRLEKTASAMEKAGYASTALAASEAFAAQIEAIMNAAENDLASVTNSDIANQVMAKYPKGSLNYQGIVRLWTSVYLAQSNQDLADAMRDIVLSTIDPTGVVGVIQAYNKPMCGEHAPIPKIKTSKHLLLLI